MTDHTGDLLFILLFMTGFGLYLIWKGFKLRRQREFIEETPTADVESVSIGPTELKGTAKPIERPIEAPFNDAECLVAQWEVEEWEQTDDGSYWNTIEEGVDFTDFYLDDGTDRIRVDPTEDAEFVIERGRDHVVWVDVDESPPAEVRSFLARSDTPGRASNLLSAVDVGKQEGDRRYRQNLLRPGDDVYVYGAVRSESAADGTDHLVIGDGTATVDTGMFMISDMRESTLLDKREWALFWRLPGGALLTALGIGGLLYFFGGAPAF